MFFAFLIFLFASMSRNFWNHVSTVFSSCISTRALEIGFILIVCTGLALSQVWNQCQEGGFFGGVSACLRCVIAANIIFLRPQNQVRIALEYIAVLHLSVFLKGPYFGHLYGMLWVWNHVSFVARQQRAESSPQFQRHAL